MKRNRESGSAFYSTGGKINIRVSVQVCKEADSWAYSTDGGKLLAGLFAPLTAFRRNEPLLFLTGVRWWLLVPAPCWKEYDVANINFPHRKSAKF